MVLRGSGIKCAVVGILLALVALQVSAETVRVGIKEAPPFVIADASGSWTGISIELWDAIAQQSGWQTEWVVLDNPQAQLDSLVAGNIDVAVGALSITPEREDQMDFSHSFYATGIAIATPIQGSSWASVLKQLVSPDFLGAVGLLVMLLLGVGTLIWLLERKRNPAQFGGSAVNGIGNGFWWSAVTMTTVGYGDKAPVTAMGRVMATVWMFFSVITISGFTATIASSLAVENLSTVVRGVQDLPRVRSVVVAGSTGEDVLRRKGISTLKVATPAEGLQMLRSGEAEALVHDEPLLRFLLKDSEPGIVVLPQIIERQSYSFGLPSGSNRREVLNQALLTEIASTRWEETLNRYLGAR